MSNKCVFYLPYELDEKAGGARMLRPRKMIQAFRDIGWDVFAITGFSHKRRELIKEFKAQVKAGAKYSFMYAESSTMPMLLTDPHHYPLHPFMDYGFFKYLRSIGVKLGLFLCDIYWKFNTYGRVLPFWKKFAAMQLYEYDIRQYSRLLDKFYLPSLRMLEHLTPPSRLRQIASELPPGCENLIVPARDYEGRDFRKDPLKIFYVGGIGAHYQFLELAKAVSMTDNCELTICCRDFEWEKVKDDFAPFMCGRIHVVHKTAGELEPFYSEADICSLIFDMIQLCIFARPVKSFEYLSHEIPVLCIKGQAAADFAEETGTGWSMDYSAEEISRTLKHIMSHPEELVHKRRNCREAKAKSLWTSRAEQVVSDLTNFSR